MLQRSRFAGSTAALVVGVLALCAGIANLQERFGTFLLGIVVVLGALAYRSAKRTKLGIVRASLTRTTLEATAIIVFLAAILLQRDFADLAYNDPIPNTLVPIWAIVAYLVAKFATGRPAPTNRNSAWS